MIHTSLHASWPNQIEIFFSFIQKKVVAPNDFASLGQLSATLLRFVHRYNQTARPFSWKFTASDLHGLMDRISRHERNTTPMTNRYRRPHDTPRRTSGATHLRDVISMRALVVYESMYGTSRTAYGATTR